MLRFRRLMESAADLEIEAHAVPLGRLWSTLMTVEANSPQYSRLPGECAESLQLRCWLSDQGRTCPAPDRSGFRTSK